MKSLILLLAVVLVSTVFAFPAGYQTKEMHAVKTELDTAEAAIVLRKVLTSVSIADATKAASTATTTTLIIPADAIITDAFLIVDETIVSADDNTIAVSCDSANDIFTATDLTDTSVAALVAAVPVGTAATGVITDGCPIVWTTGAGASGITAGAFTIVIEYGVK